MYEHVCFNHTREARLALEPVMSRGQVIKVRSLSLLLLLVGRVNVYTNDRRRVSAVYYYYHCCRLSIGLITSLNITSTGVCVCVCENNCF